jgi:4-hydroxybenzoate polyprenyltransferase
MAEPVTAVPDTENRGLIRLLPGAARPYAMLARFDRPIGWWLLFWPGAWAIALAGGAVERWDLILWFLLGSIAMRGAGCVYNDIVDRDLDRQVARTRSRPLASGAVGLKAAWIWLASLSLIGLVVLVQLNPLAAAIAVASLALVAAYPFMKRITWWPQAWLGLVFSWAALVGGAAVAAYLPTPVILLYIGSIFWVIGYDTIYALQDVEDDGGWVGISAPASPPSTCSPCPAGPSPSGASDPSRWSCSRCSRWRRTSSGRSRRSSPPTAPTHFIASAPTATPASSCSPPVSSSGPLPFDLRRHTS